MRSSWYVSASDCLLCVLESRFSELKKLGINDATSFIDLGRTVMNLAPLGRATVFIESFNSMTRMLSNNDPHADEKLMLERVAGELISGLRLGDDVIDYVKLAASANSVDVPMRGYNFSVKDFVRNILEEPAWLDTDPASLRNRLSHAGSIATWLIMPVSFSLTYCLLGSSFQWVLRSWCMQGVGLTRLMLRMTISLTLPGILKLGHYLVITQPSGMMM